MRPVLAVARQFDNRYSVATNFCRTDGTPVAALPDITPFACGTPFDPGSGSPRQCAGLAEPGSGWRKRPPSRAVCCYWLCQFFLYRWGPFLRRAQVISSTPSA